MKWHKIVARGQHPILFSANLAYGLLNTNLVLKTKTVLTKYKRYSGTSYLDEKEYQNFKNELTELIDKNPNHVKGWLFDFEKKWQKTFAESKKLPKDLYKTSNQKLIGLFLKFNQALDQLWAYGYLPFIVFDSFEEVAKKKILPKLKDKNKFFLTLNALAWTPKKLFTFQAKEELIKLALKIKNVKNIPKFKKQIQNYQNKFRFIKSWIYIYHPYTKEEIIREIKNLLKRGPRKELENLKIRDDLAKKNYQTAIREIKPDKEITNLINLLSEYCFWHTHKMEMITQINYELYPLFKEIGKRYGLSYDEVIELTPEEIENGKFDKKEITKRKKANGVLIENERLTIVTGKDIEKLKEKEEIEKTEVLKGLSANPGFAKGTAKVILGAYGKQKIRKGQILVTTMTSTHMVPQISKSAAIVTDEGGILCHAAIISRELNKPCIIGTKIATSVFKDGDRISVDANRGVVKKIEK
jgi:phosphohistidine swiveling domain-containing protein